LPGHWDEARLGGLFQERREKASDTEYPPLSVTMQGIVPQIETAAKTNAGDNRKLVRAGDFVINSRSDRKGSSGIAPQDGSVSLISIVLEPKQILPSYVHHLLRSVPFQEEFYRYGKGIVADLWSTNYGQMKNIVLPIPSPEEQRTIAAFLDHETARIDRLIEKQERLIELLKEKRQAVISHAVTKGLNPDAPMKDSGVEWLGELPAHWTISQIRYISRAFRGKFGHRPRNDPYLYGGQFPFIQTGDVARADKLIFEHHQTLNERGAAVSERFPAGTLVMAIAANVGDVAILGFDSYAPDSVIGFKPGAGVKVEFLRYSLLAARDELVAASSENTQLNLNLERVGGIHAAFPPIQEQSALVDFLDCEMQRFDKLRAMAQRSSSLLHERRSALISAAVTGKIDVSNFKLEQTESL
uniref:restriction endonuclease subunit S n=1 Tax=Roseovarius sp. TaxID=1486281 RepID=UPI00356541DC